MSARRMMLSCVAMAGLACALACDCVAAQGAGPQSASLPTIYVGKFRPVETAPAGRGPLHVLKSGMNEVKAESKAAQLSSALVEALRQRKVSAELLPEDAGARPRVGWLVQGVYYALDQNSRLVAIPMTSKQDGPNVEVSLTVADCAGDINAPFAVLGTDAVMKGQGAPVGWNPYVVAAKFVIHKVEGQDSIVALADQIAQKIIDQRQDLLSHAPLSQAAGSAH